MSFKPAARGLIASVALATFALVSPQASATGQGAAPDVRLSSAASASTQRVVAADPESAARAATACGASYDTILYAERLPTDSNRKGTVYTYTNGERTGDSYYDKPVCALFFNDTGSTHYMGVRLCDNYTSTPCDEDFGAYRSYAGPVYQNRGYCGTVYAYMEANDGSGRVLVDALRGSTPCN